MKLVTSQGTRELVNYMRVTPDKTACELEGGGHAFATFLLHLEKKNAWEKQLREERVYFDSQFEYDLSGPRRYSSWSGSCGMHVGGMQRNGCPCSACSLFIQLDTPAHGGILPIFMVCLPTSLADMDRFVSSTLTMLAPQVFRYVFRSLLLPPPYSLALFCFLQTETLLQWGRGSVELDPSMLWN